MLKITRRKNNLLKNSINYKTIMGVFDGKFCTSDDLPKEHRRKYVNSISYLKKNQLLEIKNSCLSLSDNGIWSVICAKLEISFFALWVIADMYVLEKYSRQHNISGNYPVEIIGKRFEDIISANSFKEPLVLLLRQNLIFRTSPKFYKLHSMQFESLKQYDKHLIRLQKHTCQLSTQCLEKTVDSIT